jgi:hypothetical protein
MATVNERVKIEERKGQFWIIRDGVLVAGYNQKSDANYGAKLERAKLRRLIRRQFGRDHAAAK